MQQLIDQLKADDLQRLDPPVLELRLGELIRLYTRHCTSELADSVARHFEALYLHPDISSNTTQQCALRRFAAHWRWLAARQRNGAPAAALPV